MAEPFLGEIRMMAFNFPPVGWALCNGQLLSISQNQALFSILGTTYGGNGVTTFALPNLQGRVPLHAGQGNGLQAYVLGQPGGVESVGLTAAQAAHLHAMQASNWIGDQSSPIGNIPAQSAARNVAYATSADGTNNVAIATYAGAGTPHENRQPSLVISFCIALQGVFPS